MHERADYAFGSGLATVGMELSLAVAGICNPHQLRPSFVSTGRIRLQHLKKHRLRYDGGGSLLRQVNSLFDNEFYIISGVLYNFTN